MVYYQEKIQFNLFEEKKTLLRFEGKRNRFCQLLPPKPHRKWDAKVQFLLHPASNEIHFFHFPSEYLNNHARKECLFDILCS